MPDIQLGLVEDTPAADATAAEPLYNIGDLVRVKPENAVYRYRRPHLRHPGYIHGAIGRVIENNGRFADPSRVCSAMPMLPGRRPGARGRALPLGSSFLLISSALVSHRDPKSAYREPAPPQPLYRVQFDQALLWPEGSSLLDEEGAPSTVIADVFQPWLEVRTLRCRPADAARTSAQCRRRRSH